MPKCSFCGTMYENPHGLSLVKNDGTVKHLCSSKCRKNLLMKRRKVRWVLKTKKGKTNEDLKAEIVSEVAEEHHESTKNLK